jgi:hypothetical protein
MLNRDPNRWVPGRRFLVAAGFLAVFIAAFLFLPGWSQSPPVSQPIAFNHAAHERVNATCDICHTGYETGQVAGVPAAALCQQCHEPEEDALGESQQEQVLRQYLQEAREIPWKRLLALPGDVHFSHARHVVAGQIPCEACHGPIGKAESPPERALMAFEMEACIHCHEGHDVSNDCIACHR